MNSARGSHRTLIALGLAGVLALTSCAVLGVARPATAVEPAATALTADQFASSLNRIHTSTSGKAVREGVRSIHRYTRTNLPATSSPDRSVVNGVVTVDPKRRTLRRLTERWPVIFAADHARRGPRYCVGGGDAGWEVAKDGVGRWTRADATYRRAAALVGRKGVRWKRHDKPTVIRNLFAREGVGGLLRGGQLDDPRYSGATRTPTASGAEYEADFLRGRGFIQGHLRITVDRDEALLSLVMSATAMDGHWKVDEVARNVFGPRRIKVPAAKRTIGAAGLAKACRAAGTREFVRFQALAIAKAVNAADGGATVAKIRRAARQGEDRRFDARVSPIKYGVMIVGRHKLLPHPVVSTVFIRDGKAVARKVR